MSFSEDLVNIKQAGYSSTRNSPTEQILNLLTGQNEFANKQAETKRKDFADQQKLYMTLRENGYSQEEAHSRVSRNFRSTNLLQQILDGKLEEGNKAPTGYDKFAIDQASAMSTMQKNQNELDKAPLEQKKLEAETSLATEKAAAYARGDIGKRQAAAEKMNAAQLQREIKRMSDPFENPDYDSEETKNYVAYLNQKLQQISQYPSAQPVENPAAPQQPTGARVPMVRPDGVPVQVAAKDVQKALAKGYKPRRA